ncbi:hypothetical protein LCGC14_1590630 [marine sediment metagenome]|uniref:Uncharacterized protein n=1 Tax=marine sediment metagenome TaxID=412755 RepID=A0A0F9KUS2_9ZZZZ
MTPDTRRRRQGRPDNQGTPLAVSPLTPTINALANKASGILTLTGQPLDAETVVINGKTYTFGTLVDVAAAGILTLTGQPLDGETVTIDSKVYTFRSALADVAATGILTFAGNAVNGETVTINSKVYMWQDDLTDVDGNVHIGVDAAASIVNLVAAIMLGAGAGTNYATSMTEHPTATAVDGAGDTIDFTAKTKGTGGNSIATTEAMTQGSFGAGTLENGTDAANGDVAISSVDASGSIDNLIAAMDLSGTAGDDYAIAMTAHTTVDSAAGAGDTLDATAKTIGVGGNSIDSLEGLTNGSWGAATLEGGGGAADGNVLIGGTASDSIDNLIAAVMLGAGGGTKYAAATTLHATVAAAVGVGDTMGAEAKTAGEAGNALTTTEGLTNGSWGAATLEGGSEIGSIYATGILTLTGQPLNNETVTIGTKAYTFQDSLTDVDGNVKIGADASESLDNLIAAIDLGAGSGSKYAASMTAHPDVDAAAGAGDTMDVTAEIPGDEGNSINSTQTLTNGTWGAATLEGGADTGPITQQMTAARTLFTKDVSAYGGGPDWSSDDENVHTVDQRGGLVTGVGVGAADVVATSPGVTPVATEVTVE